MMGILMTSSRSLSTLTLDFSGLLSGTMIQAAMPTATQTVE